MWGPLGPLVYETNRWLCSQLLPHGLLAAWTTPIAWDCTQNHTMEGITGWQKCLCFIYSIIVRKKSCKSALPGCGLGIMHSEHCLFPWLRLAKASVSPVAYYFTMFGQTSITMHQNASSCVPLGMAETRKTQEAWKQGKKNPRGQGDRRQTCAALSGWKYRAPS